MLKTLFGRMKQRKFRQLPYHTWSGLRRKRWFLLLIKRLRQRQSRAIWQPSSVLSLSSTVACELPGVSSYPLPPTFMSRLECKRQKVFQCKMQWLGVCFSDTGSLVTVPLLPCDRWHRWPSVNNDHSFFSPPPGPRRPRGVIYADGDNKQTVQQNLRRSWARKYIP